MSLFDKFKNLFYEEDIKDEFKDVPEETIEEVKEEVQVVPEVKKDEPVEKPINIEPAFKFPVAFDDDFEEKETYTHIDIIEKKFKMPEVPKKEKKTFKPSPMISPIHGIIEERNEFKSVKDGLLENDDRKLDLEEVRSKAFGTTISREEKYSKTENEDKEIKLFSNDELEKEAIEEQSYNLNELDEKIKTIDDLLKSTGDEEDLYSLVDKMYKDKEEGDDENDVY